MDRSKLSILLIRMTMALFFFAASLCLWGCATTATKFAKGPVLTSEVCKSAKLTTVEYFMKKSKFSGGPKLHVKVGVTNISQVPKRYRVSIFLPDGASAGGFFPRKGKPPVVKPGQEKIRIFPMYYDRIPDRITIRVEEL